MADDLSFLGLNHDDIDAATGGGSDETPFEIWPENWTTFGWFMRLQRRWVRGAMGGFIRLDDAAIQSQFDIYNVKRKQRPRLFDDLLIMETAALEILNAE